MGCSSSTEVSTAIVQARVLDESRDRDRTNEEPKVPLQEGEFGNLQLGIVEDAYIYSLLSSLGDGELYEDADFTASTSSLSYSQPEAYSDVQWLRPRELVSEPQVLVDGVSRQDIKQGTLGDCWFLSSCAAVSQQEKFMKKIISDKQQLFGKGYSGIVKFSFWRYGEWVTVYVDDTLPTRDGRLIMARCHDPNEFWVALLEKAYAKLHGSYEALEGGQAMDALVDLTGGLAECYDVTEANPDTYRHLLRAHKSGAFITCSKKGDWQEAKKDANGLVAGHAYTISKVLKITHKMVEENLLRIRNPWGDETEWTGSWSDQDSSWQSVDEDTKRKMELQQQPDGEFWMRYNDFCQHFNEVTICTTGPDYDGDGVADAAGTVRTIKGSWIPGKSAGGSRNNMNKFSTNPQYLLTIQQPDDFDPATEDPATEGKASVLIALMQEHRRSQKHLGVKVLQIAFFIYKASKRRRLPKSHFETTYETEKSGVYINLREVCKRMELEPGSYVIIPSTFDPDCSGSFMIRVFAQKNFKLQGPL